VAAKSHEINGVLYDVVPSLKKGFCTGCAIAKHALPACESLCDADTFLVERKQPGKFERIAQEIGALTEVKNVAYGDSAAKSAEVLKLLYPAGVRPDQFRDMQLVTRVLDKLFRLATKKDAFGESPWRDIAGYALLGAEKDEREKAK
jgi:hypothetical protein